MNNIDILEELANHEHIRWSNWQKYVHSKCIKNDDGSLTIPKECVEHWEYEINTDYANLPENIKESDRREVRQILEKLNYSTLIAENKELKEENKCLKNKELDYMTVYLTGTYDERDKWKSKLEELKKYEEGYKLLSYSLDNYISKDKIKAKIGKRMQKNNNTIHNAKLKHGKDYVYYDDVQEAKEENRICKEILQSLLEKE